MCGATSSSPTAIWKVKGLSPRVRGNLALFGALLIVFGPIPACAGQPLPLHGRHPTGRAYPRVCGATCTTPRTFLGVAGLSPRVRGNQIRTPERLRRFGPIPACAGQPVSFAQESQPVKAYPRVCGATKRGNHNPFFDWGLSPRVRGNRAGSLQKQSSCGPIPACAGQPSLLLILGTCSRAYPRVCGATPWCVLLKVEDQGLSPRVRGNQGGFLMGHVFMGPIPACAGQPRTRPLVLPFWGAYPRVCGATRASILTILRRLGLSPRVRGNPRISFLRSWLAGPIPACAGQPLP